LRGIVLFNRNAKRTERETLAAAAQESAAGTVGAELAAARERLGWSLADIANHLRIRRPYLAAIEQGKLAELPGEAYALGFVRTYANALGLDGEALAQRVRAEIAPVVRKPELAFPAPVPERGIPAGAVVLLGSVLAIGAYIGWYRATGEQPGAEPVRPVPERLAELAAPPPPPPAPPPAPALQAALPAPTAPMTPLPVVPPSSAAAAIVPGAMPAAPPLPAPAPVDAAGLPEGTRIVLRARAESWIQVRDRQGQVLLNRVLRAGETWPVPPGPALLMTTGNAGGTEILVDGAATPPLGPDGAVRRDLALDADAIRDGKLAAARPAAPSPAPVPRQQ
jgi:cytoskeleton protein RodZ